MLRHRMSHRPRRAIHTLAYAGWGLGLLHRMHGSDAGTVWGKAVNYDSVAAVSLALLVRIGLLVRARAVTAPVALRSGTS
jgi:hypothetical protein